MRTSKTISKSLKIGITIGLRSTNESLWINGIKQNALFLAKLFRGSPLRHQVFLLNTTDTPLPSETLWGQDGFETLAFENGWQGLDVVIELGGQVSAEQTDRLKRQGTKLVSYCCGPEYIQNIEAMIFSRPLYDSIFINQRYDVLWIIPQIWDLNRGFLQTFRRTQARRVPFVWDPIALQTATANSPENGEYRPSGTAKRLTIIEPNIDILKFCLYPILIAETAFRQMPESIGFLHAANSDRFVYDNREFVALMHHLDIVKAGKASFIGRVTTPTFLAEHTDIVISHQWGLPLNYFYLECCWQGYPLVHNAELIEDLGYYYPGSEIDKGAETLCSVIRDHDRTWQAYLENQRSKIWRFCAENPILIKEYDELLAELFEGEAIG